MLLALFSIVIGFVIIVIGIRFSFLSINGAKGWFLIPDLFGGVLIILLGLFMEFYMGWWGVIRAIIDYAKT